ncbi:SPOR domain-containing protein [Flavobacterium psychrophilum]|uniref:SPOR domain-containing protein n=1 Tax=Flavobacterium psychrophilum TaxID=96345 RepID=UPI000B7C2D8B|nr:SPOR domain-containing protein [Flavobacterium psychrophilum]EKT3956984.1 SPOR domain-containing protein [Flavobacterium psychrophilum]EKT4498639.1 SPOR domain-containing protein [Flavobacterium psychrophilum]EKT4508843.1 SPOR domain-containing protein [Flavobacterium psychrophilum]EKT4549311.1 SPOR domain-containing protein [Flavobacterium psychrophilum]EKT4552308.1 SPOR domain-containing protein [Flavobacterium psychrophilum]
MRILTFKRSFYGIAFLMFLPFNSFSQEMKNSVLQDPRFEQLLNEKRKLNGSITINDRFKIQIFTGESETSKKALTDFRKENKNIDATIVFSTPIYKVWVGNYKTRIEAENKLRALKKKYPNAFLVKPNK